MFYLASFPNWFKSLTVSSSFFHFFLQLLPFFGDSLVAALDNDHQQINRATLPLTTDTKELTECMCPNLSNMNYNNGSDMNATNVVTDLRNIPNNQGHHHHHHHHYDSEQMRFEALSSPITDINNGSNSNNTTTTTHASAAAAAAAATAASMVTANNSTNNRNGDALSNNEMTSSTSPSDGPLRHSSMDRLMSLLNEMGQTPRTRSISDGGQDEGEQN